jgi:YD repeat-containing protein
VTTSTYEPDSQLHTMVEPNGNASGGIPSAWTTTDAYNAAGDLNTETDGQADVTYHYYDGDLNQTSEKSPPGYTTSYTFDYDDRQLSQSDPGTAGTASSETYDAVGNQASSTDYSQTANTTTYAYDPLDRQTSETDANHDVTTSTYWPNGNLDLTVIKAGSNWIDVAYGSRRYHFVLAAGAGVIYRSLPAKLSSAKPGQRVDVRYYQSGSRYLATRIELLVIHVHHPRASTEYGTVGRTVPHGFVLETLSGSPLMVIYSGHVSFQEQMSVRGWAVKGGFEAEKVHQLAKLPVHTQELKGIVTMTGSGWVEVGSGKSSAVIEIEISTHLTVSSLPGSASSLKKGQYISVRFWWQGKHRVATSIHVYAKIPIPPATGAIKGTIVWVHRTTIGVHAQRNSLYILVPSNIHIRDGSHAANFGFLKVGETVSVRYYAQGKQLFATSIHIYAGATKMHTFTGIVLSYHANQLRILDRGVARIVFLSRLTTIHANGKTLRIPAFKAGQKVRVTGAESGAKIEASRIDILVPAATKTGHLPTSFRGAVAMVGHGNLVVVVAQGVRQTIRITRSTRLVVRKRTVPEAWLFPGPTVDVAVSPSAHDPTALEIVFHPPDKTVTGAIGSRAGNRMTVLERSNQRRTVALDVAGVTDDGRASRPFALESGLRVKVDGFLLPNGIEAALSVAITHPAVRMSGTITFVSTQSIDIVRTSGAKVELRFRAGVGVFSAKTNQWFRPAHLPVGAHISIHGVQEAGWIQVTSATVTFRSTVLHGSVSRIGPGHLFLFSIGAGQAVMVHLAATTKIADGHQILSFAGIEVHDLASVREYPDASGGVIASSVDIHRRLVTRTGYITSLTSTSFSEILHDDSQLQVVIGSFTMVERNGAQVPLDHLANGQKVKVEGHLRPDGLVDATKIEIES